MDRSGPSFRVDIAIATTPSCLFRLELGRFSLSLPLTSVDDLAEWPDFSAEPCRARPAPVAGQWEKLIECWSRAGHDRRRHHLEVRDPPERHQLSRRRVVSDKPHLLGGWPAERRWRRDHLDFAGICYTPGDNPKPTTAVSNTVTFSSPPAVHSSLEHCRAVLLPALPHPYSPTALAAFSRNREPSRM